MTITKKEKLRKNKIQKTQFKTFRNEKKVELINKRWKVLKLLRTVNQWPKLENCWLTKGWIWRMNGRIDGQMGRVKHCEGTA